MENRETNSYADSVITGLLFVMAILIGVIGFPFALLWFVKCRVESINYKKGVERMQQIFSSPILCLQAGILLGMGIGALVVIAVMNEWF